MICMMAMFSSIAGAYEGTFPASTADVTAAKLKINETERDMLVYRPGGGLVLSNTTAGEPLCSLAHASGIPSGEIRSCAELGWTPQTCNYTGAIARPISPSGKKVPPGFLSANDNDPSVRFAHTCNLVYALQGITDVRTEIFHFEKPPEEEGGHAPTTGYLESAWNFMKDKRSSGSSICSLSSKTDLPDAIYGLQCVAGLRQCTCQTGLDAIILILRVLAGL